MEIRLNQENMALIDLMKKSLKYFIFIAILSGLFYACISEFDPKLNSNPQRLSMESHPNTKLDFLYVYLTYDAPYNST